MATGNRKQFVGGGIWRRDTSAMLKSVLFANYRWLLAGTSRGTSGSTAVYTQCTSVCTAVHVVPLYKYVQLYTPSYSCSYCSTIVLDLVRHREVCTHTHKCGTKFSTVPRFSKYQKSTLKFESTLEVLKIIKSTTHQSLSSKYVPVWGLSWQTTKFSGAPIRDANA